jgi:hypothetical protein
MNNKTLKQINKLLKRGLSLDGIGVNNWAFSKESALNILDRFEELQVTILGGDVLELINGNIQHNYDNWYCNKLPDETDIEFARRSIIVAREYIKKYYTNDVSKILFCFVLE